MPINERRHKARIRAGDIVVAASKNMQLCLWQYGSQTLSDLHGTD